MMGRNALEVSEVARVAADAVRETSSCLTVIGTTIPAGGSDYVEVLLDIEGVETPSRRLLVGVFRNVSESTLRSHLSRQLQEQLSIRS
jgi:hypothetical protein